jgi:dolichyl-phosphate-mannose-protein mannosyltransferase
VRVVVDSNSGSNEGAVADTPASAFADDWMVGGAPGAVRTAGAAVRRPRPVGGSAAGGPRRARAAASFWRVGPWAAAALALMAFGIGVRVIAYAGRPALWLDEAMVALNIASRGFAGLARSLDWDQTAPVPFLWTTKLATLVFGVNEYALRAVPFVAGLVFLVLFWRAARALVGPPAALLATAFAACSSLLINYGIEAKQYGIDGCVAAAVLALMPPVLARPDSARPWRWLMAGGAMAMWWSMPAIFVLAGVGAALAADPRVRRTPGGYARLVTAVLVWCVVFGTLDVVAYHAATHNAYLNRFWEPSFLTLGAADASRRVTDALYQAFSGPYVLQFSPPDHEGPILLLGSGLWAVGFAAAWRRHGAPLALLLGVPIAACFAAAALGRYPVAARMLIFYTPFLFLTGASAVRAGVDLWPRAWRPVVYWAVLAAFVGWRSAKSFAFAVEPRSNAESRLAIAALDRTTGADPIYLFAGGVPGWLFYTTDWQAPDTVRLRWYADVASSGGRAFANAPSRGSRAPRAPREVDGLEYWYHGRREIVGVGDGMEYRAGVKFVTPRPDPDWAPTEAERLRAAAHPSASIYVSHFTPEQLAPLMASVVRAGGTITWAWIESSAAGYRVRFGDGG